MHDIADDKVAAHRERETESESYRIKRVTNRYGRYNSLSGFKIIEIYVFSLLEIWKMNHEAIFCERD